MADIVKRFGLLQLKDTGTVFEIEYDGTVRLIINKSTGAVTLGSVDGTGANDLITDTISADTVAANSLSMAGTGVKSYILCHRLTTTQRDAISPAAGMIIYNTTDSKLQVYSGGAWVDLH